MHSGPRYIMKDGKESYFGSAPVGCLESFSIDEFRERGLSIVLKSLEEFHQRKVYDDSPRSELEMFAPKAKRQFYANHYYIFVTLTNDGRIRLAPMRHKVIGKSAMGIPGAERYASVDTKPEDFMKILEEVAILAD
jgi:hypothetical protein